MAEQPIYNSETHAFTFPEKYSAKVCSEETRKKLSETRARYLANPENREKISKFMKGHSVSEATKDKIRQAKIGTHFSEEAKLKMSLSHKGVPLSEEHKRNLSKANKGKVISEEQRRKISKALSGKPISEEHKRNISVALKGHTSLRPNGIFVGENNPFYGKHHTEETKLKLSKMNKLGICGRKGQKNTPEHNAKISAANKLAYSTLERKAMISNRECYKTPEYREKMSNLRKATLERKRGTPEQIAQTAAWRAKIEEWIKEHGYPHTGFKATKEQLKRMSDSHKKLWQDPEYTKMMKEAIQQRPNVPELMLEDLLNNILPNKYSYVGDWAIFIGGINPDFISNDGENKVIEMFGDHWHKGENPQERIDKFAEQGLDCLVIWEHELWEESLEELVKKILEFDKA